MKINYIIYSIIRESVEIAYINDYYTLYLYNLFNNVNATVSFVHTTSRSGLAKKIIDKEYFCTESTYIMFSLG